MLWHPHICRLFGGQYRRPTIRRHLVPYVSYPYRYTRICSKHRLRPAGFPKPIERLGLSKGLKGERAKQMTNPNRHLQALSAERAAAAGGRTSAECAGTQDAPSS